MSAASRTIHSSASLTHELRTLKSLTNYHAWIFEELRPFLGTRLAEVGGGLGAVAAVLAREHLLTKPGTSLDVFEPDTLLFASLGEFLHLEFAPLMQAGRLRTVQSEFESALHRYDSIILVNALEHIEDDRGLLGSIGKALAPQGTLIVYVPALPWLYSTLDRDIGHFRRYDMGRLRELFESQGLEVVKAIYMDLAGIVPWFLLNVLLRSKAINPGLARFYDRWGVPIIKPLERGLGAPIGKNILMIGRKQESQLK